MAYTHRLVSTLYVDNTPIPTTGMDETFTSTGRASITETVVGGSTDAEISIAIDVSAVASLFMYCLRDITIETNSGSAADATINLKAGQPLHWHPTSYFTNPLGAVDVASIFVTLAAGDDAELIVEVIQDATP